MKKVISLFLLLIILLNPIISFAQEDLIINSWVVESRLLENGNLIVSEDIKFEFNRSFNGVFRYIVLDRTDGISDINVYEVVNGKEVFYSLKPNAVKGDSNVFNYKMDESGINIAIFSPSNKERKTFRVSYVLDNVVTIHKDTGEFYYKYLGRENETPINYFSASLELPEFDMDSIYIFAHGPLSGNIHFVDDLIKLEVENVPTNTFVEARVLYPTEYTPLSTRTGNKDLDTIIGEERSFVESNQKKAQQKLFLRDLFNKISIALLAIGALIGGFIFNKFRRNPDIYSNMTSLNPKEISPAELNLFMTQTINSRGLMATIFDLARREYLSIDEVDSAQEGKKRVNKQEYLLTNNNKSDSGLLEHEKYLMDWLFNTIGNGNHVSTKEIDTERSKRAVAYSKDFNGWLKLVRKSLDSRNYVDKGATKTGGLMLIFVFVIFIVATFSIVNGGMMGVALILLSGILFVYSIILMTRKSDEGYIQYGLWKDYKKEVENLRNLNIGIPQDKSLIYAVALGLSAKDLDSYRQVYGPDYYPLYWGYWYFLYNNKGGSQFEDRFNRSFYGSTGNSSGTTTTFGGGGGFSGGGGGGAGGGGAGGF